MEFLELWVGDADRVLAYSWLSVLTTQTMYMPIIFSCQDGGESV